MRIWRIRYTGYNSYSYEQPFIRDPEANFFLSEAAAQANIPLQISPEDQREFQVYGDLARFEVYEDKITNFALWMHGFYERENEGTLGNIWTNERWWKRYGQHSIMANANDARLVEFFDDVADRAITMKPGKYLKKYYSEILTDRQIAFNAEYWTTGKKPEVPLTLHLATTEEDILRVYRDGPKSCMKNSVGVSAYAAGDLAIAYATDAEDKIVGRTVCWPERKIYGRIYPDPRNWEQDGFESQNDSVATATTIANILRSQDYVSIQENPTGFDGARVKVEPIKGRETEGFIKMPYLDNDLRLEITDDREFRLKKDGPIRSTSTGGYIRLIESECAVCNTSIVVNSDNPEARVCRNFYDYNYTDRDSRPVICSSCANGEHVVKCEVTEERYLATTTEFVAVHRHYHSGVTKTVVRGYFDEYGWTSEGNGYNYLTTENRPTIIDGKKYHRDELIYSEKLDKYFPGEEAKKKAEKEFNRLKKMVKIRPFQLPAQAAA